MGSYSSDIPELNGTFSVNPLDPQEFRRQGHMIIDFLADYYENVHKHPVRSQVEPGYLQKRLPESAPYHPESIETILSDITEHIIPGITHWQSPNYFAYFPSSGSTAGFLGEMLSTGINAVCFNWMSSPAATELETIVTDWLGKLLKLPEPFLFSGGGGGVQTDDFSLTPKSLQQQISTDVAAGLIPLFLCATVGTTSSTAVDQLSGLCQVAVEYEMWVHVDAAYAGSACICPEFRHFIDGIEGASSFSFNAHKWFFINLDCCCLWVKEPQALINALSTNPEFLRNKATESKKVVDYKDWQIALSRRFRAMKLWMVLRSYGVTNLRSYLRSHVNMAKLFENMMRKDERFEVVAPRNFAMVCFRVRPKGCTLEEVNELNSKMLESINASGRLYMSHTVLGEMYVIRFAVGATLTEVKHVKSAWGVLGNPPLFQFFCFFSSTVKVLSVCPSVCISCIGHCLPYKFPQSESSWPPIKFATLDL